MKSQRYPELHQLVTLLGIQTRHRDGLGNFCRPDVEQLMRGVRAMGYDLQEPQGAGAVARSIQQSRAQRMLEPVHAFTQRSKQRLALYLDRRSARAGATFSVDLEDGSSLEWRQSLGRVPVHKTVSLGRDTYLLKQVSLPKELPVGYHTVHLSIGSRKGSGHLLVAPSKAVLAQSDIKSIGVFAPLYAVRSAENWGMGNFADLGELCRWAAEHDAGVLGTLPLLPAFYEEPFEPSPYAPVSRCFWNEYYVHVPHLDDLAHHRLLCKTIKSARWQRRLEKLRATSLVDYRGVAACKREVMEALARSRRTPAARQELDDFLSSRPEVHEYAAFRATHERLGRPFHQWSQGVRADVLKAGQYDKGVYDFYVYGQWQAAKQLSRAAREGAQLYLDLPLGVHSDGYDAWKQHASFAKGVSVGAPPDAFFSEGQDWGFAPLDPARQREAGYEYVRSCLRHHFSVARMLRIDHVMGLFRLFWIPHGHGSANGFYVRYPDREQLAVLTIEASRANVQLVGEDLGTVPARVRAEMQQRNILRMYVGQFEMQPNDQGLNEPPRGAVASLNTHDMVPFAGFWKGKDIDVRVSLGLLDPTAAGQAHKARKHLLSQLEGALRRRGLIPSSGRGKLPACLSGCLHALAQSDARLLLLTLEDLWCEEEPQNTPGTWRERPNWQRKMSRTMSQLWRSRNITKLLRQLHEARLASGSLQAPPSRAALR